MKTIVIFVAIFLLILLLATIKEDLGGIEMNTTNLTLTTIYDNYGHGPELKTGWGFSCLVETGSGNILFDTGADSPAILGNMEKLDIDPKDIETVVLSHIHGDHTGWLPGLLKANPHVKVCLPKSFPGSFKEQVKACGAEVIEVGEAAKISEGVWTTGELGTWIKEQSLLVNTDKGLVVITGCAHPGIVHILEEAKGLTGEEIYLAIGGFHLSSASDSELREIVSSFRRLGVKKAAPCHCSGDRARELFREEYGSDFIPNGVGMVVR